MPTPNGQTAQTIINDLNGVTFGQGALGGTEITSTTYDGYNPAGGYTDVYTNDTNASTGEVQVAYITGLEGGAHHPGGQYYPLGSPGMVTSAVYEYTPASGSDFATFGYLTFGDVVGGSQKYWIHGFSQYGLLLSESSTFTEGDANGLYSRTNTYLGGHNLFDVLSTKDLGIGPTSTVGSNAAPGSSGGYHYIDQAGVAHVSYTPIFKGANNTYGNAAPDNNPNPPTYPLTFTNSASNFDQASIPCFAEGTAIQTVRGAVAVEDLVEGDEVVTASGPVRPVIWIGQKTVRPARHPRPHEVNPVRIRKGAFAEGLPARDLVISPGHAVYVEGVLIPAHSLVNGATIVQETVDSVRYFHVELDAHDVLLADGLPCESYLDDGNRGAFSNGGDVAELYGRLDPKSWENACAPWVGAGPQLDEVRRRLLGRAEDLGWIRSDEAHLYLVVDGLTVAPLQVAGDRAWFQVPACAELTLTSNASVLAQVMPGLTDLRRLGVAVGELRVNGDALALDGPAFGQGFHGLESSGEHAWRWTDGQGTLVIALDAPAVIEVAVLMVAPSWKRPAKALGLVRVA
jgi:hypothetical protein